jgi:hypothetical protein
MEENPEMQIQLVSSHGMLAILEVLEGRVSRDVAVKLLQIINLVSSGLVCLIHTLIFAQLVTSDVGFLESFCLIGYVLLRFPKLSHSCFFYSGIPVVMGELPTFARHRLLTICVGFTSKKYASECRLEASNFIRLLCHTSVLTLQMFIAYVTPIIFAYLR